MIADIYTGFQRVKGIKNTLASFSNYTESVNFVTFFNLIKDFMVIYSIVDIYF